MFKNIYARLILISIVTTLAFLITIPKVQIKVDNKLLKLDTTIGGYSFAFQNFVFDFSDFKRGLDLKGGIRIVLKADIGKIDASAQTKALESAKEIISRRVNMLGVTEPYVTTSKVGADHRIIVEIPGVDNTSQAVSLIGQTAQLRFKELQPDLVWDETTIIQYSLDPQYWFETGVSGADLRGAEVILGNDGPAANKPQIKLLFTNEGLSKFSEVLKRNVGRPIGLYLDEDNIPLSFPPPIVSPELAAGLTTDPVISGNFTYEEANNLSIQIRAGALPVPVQIIAQETIGATLGDASVRQSFFAAAVGLVLVLLFLVFKYGFFGIFAAAALVIYSIIVLALFKILSVTLTLPGIAGFVLSIGMATDANILIFERIKEEIFWGKSRSLAISLGFDRAWNSIKDSNVSSLITSLILFQLGSGPVKGFALTLALGIAVSLFTSIFVTRTLIELFSGSSSSDVKDSKGKKRYA